MGNLIQRSTDGLIQWICPTCHRNVTDLVAGAKNGVVKCPSCGNDWTVPKQETASGALKYLHDGNAALDVCKFEDAFTYFQKAAELDSKEPEAHFGMALAQFKVQYLKDEVNNCLQPICHEISEKVFTENKNYKKALELATVEQKKVYRKRGGEIDNIREEFFELKKQGTTFDCFICVKVTEEDGSQTKDRERASMIYEHLKDKGYKPFYSEREMKGRTGSAYEALILYALYTSECMLLVCSNEDYLQTKWVKNEYTRFISLIQESGKERDALTFVFAGNAIEKLPNGKKIQGIDLTKPDAYSRITEYVEKHTPEARKKKVEEEAIREKRAEEQKETLAAMQKQIDELTKARDTATVSKKAAPIAPISGEFTIKGTTLVDYRGEDEVVKIPNKIRKIDEAAFCENQMIRKVIMPDSLTIIGNQAFIGCTGLKEIVLSPNLTDIGNGAFQNCARLTEVTIPQSVEVMGDDVFAECHCDIYVEAHKAGRAWQGSWNGSTGRVFWGCRSKADWTKQQEDLARQQRERTQRSVGDQATQAQHQTRDAVYVDPSKLLANGNEELSKRNYDVAKKYYDKILQMNANSSCKEDAREGLILIDLKLGHWSRIQEDLEKGLLQPEKLMSNEKFVSLMKTRDRSYEPQNAADEKLIRTIKDKLLTKPIPTLIFLFIDIAVLVGVLLLSHSIFSLHWGLSALIGIGSAGVLDFLIMRPIRNHIGNKKREAKYGGMIKQCDELLKQFDVLKGKIF